MPDRICVPRMPRLADTCLQALVSHHASFSQHGRAWSISSAVPAGRVQDHPTDRRLRQELRKLSSALDKLGLKCRRQGLQLQASAAREQYWKSLAVTRQAGVEQVGLPCVQAGWTILHPSLSAMSSTSHEHGRQAQGRWGSRC